MREAFAPDAVAGGVVGALIQGFRRAAFANEAGIGSAPMAHATVRTNEPMSQGFAALMEPFLDTIIICLLTALVIVVSGVNETSANVGIALTSDAFATVVPWFPAVLAVVAVLFALSTVLAWGYYGEQAWMWLFSESQARAASRSGCSCARMLSIAATFPLDQVVNIVDSCSFCMAIPNIIAIYLLMPELRADLASYWQRVVLKRRRGEQELSRKTYLWMLARRVLPPGGWSWPSTPHDFATTGCWKTCWWCWPSRCCVYTYKSFPLSRVSYTCIFVFMMLHALGAHYTYAKVPYDEWFPVFEGGRNHFDRLVHFAYGLLLAYPIREMFLRIGNVRGFWGYFLPLDLTMSTSMLYELIEWAAAEVVGGDLGAAYLGTQGDVWDAHKDMALASLGALIAMTAHRADQPAHAARLRARVGREHPREAQEAAGRRSDRQVDLNGGAGLQAEGVSHASLSSAGVDYAISAIRHRLSQSAAAAPATAHTRCSAGSCPSSASPPSRSSRARTRRRHTPRPPGRSRTTRSRRACRCPSCSMPFSSRSRASRGLPVAAYTHASVCAMAKLLPCVSSYAMRAASTARSSTGCVSSEVHAYWL